MFAYIDAINAINGINAMIYLASNPRPSVHFMRRQQRSSDNFSNCYFILNMIDVFVRSYSCMLWAQIKFTLLLQE